MLHSHIADLLLYSAVQSVSLSSSSGVETISHLQPTVVD